MIWIWKFWMPVAICKEILIVITVPSDIDRKKALLRCHSSFGLFKARTIWYQ
jgi:hypothetical protein